MEAKPYRRIYKGYHPYRVGSGWDRKTYAKQGGVENPPNKGVIIAPCQVL